MLQLPKTHHNSSRATNRVKIGNKSVLMKRSRVPARTILCHIFKRFVWMTLGSAHRISSHRLSENSILTSKLNKNHRISRLLLPVRHWITSQFISINMPQTMILEKLEKKVDIKGFKEVTRR